MTALFLGLMLLPAGDHFADGLRAWREGRFEDSFLAFAAAREQAGDLASPELLYNLALAALQCGRPAEAQAAAEAAARKGGDEFAARRDFVFGNLAFLDALRAQVMSFGPEGGETSLDEGISACERAMAAWISAATTRDEWPEASRNIERARRLLAQFRQRKEEAAANRQSTKNAMPPPSDPGADQKTEEDPDGRPKAMLRELSSAEIMKVFDRLEQKQRDKRQGRQGRVLPPSVSVERDW